MLQYEINGIEGFTPPLTFFRKSKQNTAIVDLQRIVSKFDRTFQCVCWVGWRPPLVFH